MKTAITSFCVLCAACGAREASDEIKDALATPTPTPAAEAKAEPEEQPSIDRQEAVKLEKVDPTPTPTPAPTPVEKIIVVIQPTPAPQHTPEEIAERRQAFYVQCFRTILPELLETNESQVARRKADDTCKIWRECSVEKLFSTADGWPIN